VHSITKSRNTLNQYHAKIIKKTLIEKWNSIYNRVPDILDDILDLEGKKILADL